MRGPDEFDHVVRASTISHGYLVPPPSDANPGDYRLDGCTHALQKRSFEWAATDRRLPWGSQFDTVRCAKPFEAHIPGRASSIGNAEVNPPLAYVPAAVGLRVGRAIGGPLWAPSTARVLQLAAYLALVWCALRLLPFGRPLLVAVALIPSAIQLAATVSADAVTNGVAFLVVAATLRFVHRAHQGGPPASRSELIGYGVAVVALAVCKPAVLPIVGVALLVPTPTFGSLRRRVVTVGVLLGAAVGLAAAWSLAVTSHVRVSMIPGADSLAMRDWISAHPLDFVVATWRGWTDPGWVHMTLSTFLPSPITTMHSLWLILALAVAVGAAYFADRPAAGATHVAGRRSPRTEAETTWDGATDSGHEPGPGPGPGLRPSRFTGLRPRLLAVAVVAGIAVAGFWLIEIGVALSAIPPGSPKIVGVQGRYFIAYVPLVLLLSAGRRASRTRPRLVAAVAPIVFLVGVNLWWLTVVYRTYYV